MLHRIKSHPFRDVQMADIGFGWDQGGVWPRSQLPALRMIN
jgi:hypothetical protein